MKKAVSFTGTLLLAVSVLTACSHAADQQTAAATVKKKAPDNNTTVLHIQQATAQKNGNMLTVNAQIKNASAKAMSLNSGSFTLTLGQTVLTPDAKSDIPQQVKGNKTVLLKLQFDLNQAKGKKNLKLAFQPSNSSKPKQIVNLGTMLISQSPSNLVSNSSTTTTSKSTQSTISLEMKKVGPVDVKIPKGWVKSAHTGGAYPGYDFTNPKDSNQKMVVMYSPCTGCGYPNGDPGSADPHPDKLIPQSNVSHKFIFNSGLSAGYSYSVNGNPNNGDGVVTMVQGEGYSYVEVLLPASMKSTASEILNSFAFHGYY